MKRIVLLVILLVAITPENSLSQNRATFQLGANVVTDSSRDYWGPGIGMSIKALHYSHPNIAYGFNLGINLNGSSGEFVFSSYSKLLTIEAMPMLRIQTNRSEESLFDVYLQTAIGLMIVDGSRVSVDPVSACAGCSTVGDGSTNLVTASTLGMNIGLGLVSNNNGKARYDMTLVYHVGFTSPETNQFVSLSIGVMLGE